jgi:hypothetical protein
VPEKNIGQHNISQTSKKSQASGLFQSAQIFEQKPSFFSIYIISKLHFFATILENISQEILKYVGQHEKKGS